MSNSGPVSPLSKINSALSKFIIGKATRKIITNFQKPSILINNSPKSPTTRKKFTLAIKDSMRIACLDQSSERKKRELNLKKSKIENFKEKFEEFNITIKKEVKKIQNLQYLEVQKLINSKFKKTQIEREILNEDIFFQIKDKDLSTKKINTCNWSGHEVIFDLRVLNNRKEESFVFTLNQKDYNVWIKGLKGYVNKLFLISFFIKNLFLIVVSLHWQNFPTNFKYMPLSVYLVSY